MYADAFGLSFMSLFIFYFHTHFVSERKRFSGDLQSLSSEKGQKKDDKKKKKRLSFTTTASGTGTFEHLFSPLLS